MSDKFSDILGRRPVLSFGIVVFLFSSVMYGIAWSMLIVLRAVQDIGSGAILPNAMTIVGDTYTVKERTRVQGYLAGVALIGSLIVVLGLVLCTLLANHVHIWQVATACFVIGLGMGLITSPTVVVVQSVVGWQCRGVITGANMFSRSLGSAVGAAVFGAIAKVSISGRFAESPPGLASQQLRSADATNAVLGGSNAKRDSAVAELIQNAVA